MKITSRTLITLILPLLLGPIQVLAQETKVDPKAANPMPFAELERVLEEAQKLNDKNAAVCVKAQAAMLLTFANPDRADKMFRELWKYTNSQTDKDFDKGRAKLQILRSLASRNPKLARQFLAEQSTEETSSNEHEAQLEGKLAFQLADADASMAAALIEDSLQTEPTTAGMGALIHLREKDPLLSDYVASKVLESLPAKKSRQSLSCLQLFAAYMFSGPDTLVALSESESSLQLLHYRYFLTANEVLNHSLQESNDSLLKDQNYTQRDLALRAANQAMVAAILAALAPRLAPSLAPGLSMISSGLATQVPPNVAQITRSALARLSGDKLESKDPEQLFAFDLASEKFDEARAHLEQINDGDKRRIYEQLLLKKEARSLLAKSDIIGALVKIRKLEDKTNRLVMYLDALTVIKKKRDMGLTNIIINEARLLVPQTDRNGLHARALLSFASQLMNAGMSEQALEFLNGAVVTINSLATVNADPKEPKSLADYAFAQLNDPNSFLDAPEMEQAFSAAGRVDLETALSQAVKIEPRAVQLLARLQAVQNAIKNSNLKTLAKPSPIAVAPK